MVDGQRDTSPESVRAANSLWKFARIAGAIVLGFFGIALLVATKTTAGAACVCAALLVGLPFERLVGHKSILNWVRAVLIAVLCAIAVRSIGGTDIVPEQERTGYAFADRVLAISQRFLENIGAKNPTPRGPKHSPHEREMDADE
jgi:hypothetical protein